MIQIDLSYNPITNQGIKAISNYLKSNKSLVELSLFGIPTDDESVKYMCDALKYNNNLQELNLNTRGWTVQTYTYLKDILSVNYSLLKFKEEISPKWYFNDPSGRQLRDISNDLKIGLRRWEWEVKNKHKHIKKRKEELNAWLYCLEQQNIFIPMELKLQIWDINKIHYKNKAGQIIKNYSYKDVLS